MTCVADDLLRDCKDRKKSNFSRGQGGAAPSTHVPEIKTTTTTTRPRAGHSTVPSATQFILDSPGNWGDHPR